MKKINILLPCYNEEENVRLFYTEAQKELGSLEYEFHYTYIDDGSLDNTKNAIQELSQEVDYVHGILFSRNYGKEAAILAGLDNSKSYDACVIIDVDLEMPIRYIKSFIEAWESGHKLVLSKKEARKRGLKSFLASSFYKVYNRLADVELLPDALDFQLLDQQVIHEVCRYREINRFYKGISASVGFNPEVFEIQIDTRIHGESKFSSFSSLFGYAFTSLSNNSTFFLKLALYMGSFISLGSFIYIVYVIAKQLLYGSAVEGWSSLVAIVLFSFGVTLLFLGIIGYYISLLFEEVKNRPKYIVDEFID